MPITLILLALDIWLLFHASRTGRLNPWAFIILLLPGIGGLAYFVVEVLPEWLGSSSATNARRRVAATLDPSKQYRILRDNLAETETIANRAALAAECLRLGHYDEAREHYDHILQQPLGVEPSYAFGKAKAEFGLGQPAAAVATLEDLRSQWPGFQSADAHLLYARALEDVGRTAEALEEFQAVAAYFPGCEARARYGLLLERAGRVAEAKEVFADLVRQMKRAPRHVRMMQREWFAIAEKRLSA